MPFPMTLSHFHRFNLVVDFVVNLVKVANERSLSEWTTWRFVIRICALELFVNLLPALVILFALSWLLFDAEDSVLFGLHF